MERPQFVHHKLETILNIEKVVSILYTGLPKDYAFDGESHNFWEFVYVDKGTIIATKEKKEILLREGEIIFHKPNEIHALRADGKNESVIFIISFACSSPAIRYFCDLHTRLASKLRTLIREIIKERDATFYPPFISTNLQRPVFRENPILGGQQLIRNYLQILLIQMMRLDTENRIFSNQEHHNEHLTQNVILYLEQHLYNGVNVDAICSHFNYSKTYLCSVFKKTSGKSIMQYYNHMRLEEAKALLINENLSITQISDKLSFCNPHYFSHAFRKYSHMSPKQYRKSIHPD